MQISRRSLVRNIGLGIAGVSAASRTLAKAGGASESESLLVKDRLQPEPRSPWLRSPAIGLVQVRDTKTERSPQA